MKITPSPRILSMLGEIEIAEWQCLAELIDNSADELTSMNLSVNTNDGMDSKDSCIEIVLPTSRATRETAEVEVRDHGRGMSREQLQDAVKAGWTGNNPFDRLGLFGMGFNVATARLGRVTEILTTRAGESTWRGVRIDLDSITDDFEVPEISEPKSDAAIHGTRVRVQRLDPDRLRFLTSKHEVIRQRLGHIYSWLLVHTPISIRINGKLVSPFRHCVWDESRSVVHGKGINSEVIPAVIQIDHKLPDAESCGICGHWQKIGLESCEVCANSDLDIRPRRIHGWVGIQRYLSTDQFGIDFIRNGRKILTADKSVFDWIDINDPSGTPIKEYPIELPANNGRIVGEIHLDHVPVDYKKDRFETSSREWIAAIELIRGEGPLRPQAATKYNFGLNYSPIGRLFRGFQRNNPGMRHLIPGDGQRAMHQQAASWGQLYARGDAEYQSDLKWWEAVVEHEEKAARKNIEPAPAGEADESVVLEALGGSLNDEAASPSSDSKQPGEDDANNGSKKPAPQSLKERADILRNASRPLPSLSRLYRIPSIQGELDIKAWAVPFGSIQSKQENSESSPFWLNSIGGGRAEIFIDEGHSSLRNSGLEETDLAIAEVAFHLGTQRSAFTSGHTMSTLIIELREFSFRDLSIDFSTIQESARSLFENIRERLIQNVEENPERAWTILNEAQISELEAIYSGNGIKLVSTDSRFIEHVPASYVARLFENWPEVFTDGKVFDDIYGPLVFAETKKQVASKISSLLFDCAYVASTENEVISTNELKRARLATQILEQKISVN